MKEILPSLPVQYRQADLPDAGMLGYIYYESWMSTVKGVLPERYLEPYTPEALADAMYRLIGTTYAYANNKNIANKPVDCSSVCNKRNTAACRCTPSARGWTWPS